MLGWFFRIPLNAVHTFVCTAGLLSYTRAAEELNVTQGVVNWQIAILESYLGQHLFHRVGRGIALTYVGERYASDVCKALARLEFASTRIRHRSDESLLIVGATVAVSCWVNSRLTNFQRAHRSLSVHLRNITAATELHGFDIAVLDQTATEPSVESPKILHERRIPYQNA